MYMHLLSQMRKESFHVTHKTLVISLAQSHLSPNPSPSQIYIPLTAIPLSINIPIIPLKSPPHTHTRSLTFFSSPFTSLHQSEIPQFLPSLFLLLCQSRSTSAASGVVRFLLSHLPNKEFVSFNISMSCLQTMNFHYINPSIHNSKHHSIHAVHSGAASYM